MSLSRFTLLAATFLIAAPCYAQGRGGSIRSIDFKNFTYPLPADLRTPGGARTVTLKFTRRRYVWLGRRFRHKGRKEVIPLPAPSNR